MITYRYLKHVVERPCITRMKTYCPDCSNSDIGKDRTDNGEHIYFCKNCGCHFWIISRDNLE